MQNKRFDKEASARLLSAYLNLIILTVFHFHLFNFNDQTASIDSSRTAVKKGVSFPYYESINSILKHEIDLMLSILSFYFRK